MSLKSKQVLLCQAGIIKPPQIFSYCMVKLIHDEKDDSEFFRDRSEFYKTALRYFRWITFLKHYSKGLFFLFSRFLNLRLKRNSTKISPIRTSMCIVFLRSLGPHDVFSQISKLFLDGCIIFQFTRNAEVPGHRKNTAKLLILKLHIISKKV